MRYGTKRTEPTTATKNSKSTLTRWNHKEVWVKLA
jgi:hypothetical protein